MTDAAIRAELAQLAEQELLDVIGELRRGRYTQAWHERFAERLEIVLTRVRAIGGAE